MSRACTNTRGRKTQGQEFLGGSPHRVARDTGTDVNEDRAFLRQPDSQELPFRSKISCNSEFRNCVSSQLASKIVLALNCPR